MSIFSWFTNLFHKLFSGDLDKEIKEYVKYAVEAFQYIKDGFKNPALHKITDVIPGDWDLKLLDTIEGVAGTILDELIKGQACIEKETFGDKFRCFVAMVSGDEVLKTKAMNSFAVSLGIELVKEFVTKSFNLNKILILVPAVFEELFGKKN